MAVDRMFIQSQIFQKFTAYTEFCVKCGADSGFDTSMPCEHRMYYVADVGQLCKRCHETHFST